MKTGKVPTAEELLSSMAYCDALSGDEYEVIKVMKEFAKLHVKAALEAAADVACVTESWGDRVVNTWSILEAYPDELIK